MNRSLKIGRAAGIPLFLHWTFLLVPAYVILSGLAMGRPLFGILADLTFVAVIFSCVVLHELGHALAARRFGVNTRDIILMPIGGVARLERMPKRPKEELLVALAGPAVNVVIAAVLLLLTVPFIGVSGLVNPTSLSSNLVSRAIAVNLAMIVFNMLPAFPMDGGRVLRALLSSRLGHLKATRIASSVGRTMAILFGLAGLFVFNNPMLIFIAGFVYLGAGQEAGAAEMEASISHLRVDDAMMTRFDTIPAQASAEWALKFALSANQQETVVASSGVFEGVVKVEDLAAAVADGQGEVSVAEHCCDGVVTVQTGESLSLALADFQSSSCLCVPVLNAAGYVQGLITLGSMNAARRFGPLLNTIQNSAFNDMPDELRHHLARLQV